MSSASYHTDAPKAPTAPLAHASAFKLGTVLLITLSQFGWLYYAAGPRLAWLNLLPAVLLIAVWTLFIAHFYAHRPLLRLLLLAPVLVLNLRLPVTVLPALHVVNWCMVVVMAGAVLRQVLTQFSTRAGWLHVLATVAVLTVNGATHLGLDSPYGYTFRMTNDVPSAYAGVDNNTSWECAYERAQYPVHCDARHFVASEKIFTEPGFDPSYSVVLQRFGHGYLNSLVGIDGTRWWTNLCINFLFWFFACACIYRISRLLQHSQQVAGLSMLCCASGIGFVGMFAQPLPYLLAYAFGPIAIWATLELIYSSLDRWRSALFVVLIASVVTVYDAFQLILVSALMLFLHKKKQQAVLVIVLALVLTAVWRVFSMKMVLGTQGDLASFGSTVGLLGLDVATWLEVAKTTNIAEFFRLSWLGATAYVYGNLIIAAVAAWAYIAGVGRSAAHTPQDRTFLIALISMNVLMLLAMIFVVPHMQALSPTTGMQPRLAFYSYPVNVIALMLIATAWLKRWAWIVPLGLFMVVNVNLTGLASVDMFFDFGKIGVFWK